MGMNVTGEDIMVFAKEYNGRTSYSLGVSSRKYENGRKTDEWIKAYMYVQFPRDDAPRDREKIDIKKAFFSAYENRDGGTGFKLIVQEWCPHGKNDYGYDWGRY